MAVRVAHFAALQLETLNNLIQYQYEGNARVIYSVVRYSKSFKRLAELSLDNGDADESSAPAPAAVAPSSSGAPFAPTQQWLDEWKRALPLGTVLRLLEHLLPAVRSCLNNDADDEERVLAYLHNSTLVGVLPVPHPIIIRKYQANSATTSWFRGFLYGVVYVRNQSPPLFFGTKVKLFRVAVQ